jgi:hypothetical protein
MEYCLNYAVNLLGKGKVKFTLEQAMKAQRGVKV